MCLGIPGQIVEIRDAQARLGIVEIAGVRREVNLSCVLQDGVSVQDCIGQWVLVHVGFAMAVIDEQEAQRTLALLEEHGITPKVVLYLESPPDEKTIRNLLGKLNFTSAHDLVRTSEADYKAAGLSRDASSDDIIRAMVRAPKLIERPIVVKGRKAVLGRPPENVLDLIATD